MSRTQTRNAMRAQLERIAVIVTDYFDPACEEGVVDGVESMAEELSDLRDTVQIMRAKLNDADGAE